MLICTSVREAAVLECKVFQQYIYNSYNVLNFKFDTLFVLWVSLLIFVND